MYQVVAVLCRDDHIKLKGGYYIAYAIRRDTHGQFPSINEAICCVSEHISSNIQSDFGICGNRERALKSLRETVKQMYKKRTEYK